MEDKYLEIKEMAKPGENVAYLVLCRDNTLYCGWTNDLDKRVKAHNEGKGAKYTKSRRPVRLAYSEEYGTRKEAMKRECAIKRMTRQEKLELIKKGNRPG